MQLPLDISPDVPAEAYEYGTRSSGETHGLVLTKPHIVALILDLTGYRPDLPLHRLRLLEPACGNGVFVVDAARRLLRAATAQGIAPGQLRACITAFDIDHSHVKTTRAAVTSALLSDGVSHDAANELAESWVQQGDSLLARLEPFDFVVGNPPYVRIEQLSPQLQAEYRIRYSSLYDRADLYVAFIERGLTLLAPHGALGYICADRWTSNKYGAPLRKLVADSYSVKCYVDLHKADPFESEVSAYPSIFVIGRDSAKSIPVITMVTGSPEECTAVGQALTEHSLPSRDVAIARHSTWFSGSEPWILTPPEHRATLRTLERKFHPIEDTCKIGIGVATGNDSIYIVDASADIESDRLVPLVKREDISQGQIADNRHRVINTFSADGSSVDLADYPKLSRYFEAHRAGIMARHVAKRNQSGWFRTIDRVYPELTGAPKLLIPDIAGATQVTYDEGHYYPHHNLYFVTSTVWDPEVLGGLLSSKVALFFVWSYGVKMRGGYLRFQAQYLRRIHLPSPDSLPQDLSKNISLAFRGRDFGALDSLALSAFGLSSLPQFDFVDTRR